jgi:hypothetical protein
MQACGVDILISIRSRTTPHSPFFHWRNCQLKPRSGSRDTGRNEEVPVHYFLLGIFLDLDLFFACRLQSAWE